MTRILAAVALAGTIASAQPANQWIGRQLKQPLWVETLPTLYCKQEFCLDTGPREFMAVSADALVDVPLCSITDNREFSIVRTREAECWQAVVMYHDQSMNNPGTHAIADRILQSAGRKLGKLIVLCGGRR